jgi:hypothetical protein
MRADHDHFRQWAGLVRSRWQAIPRQATLDTEAVGFNVAISLLLTLMRQAMRHRFGGTEDSRSNDRGDALLEGRWMRCVPFDRVR